MGIGEEGGRWCVERSADAAGVDAGERETGWKVEEEERGGGHMSVREA